MASTTVLLALVSLSSVGHVHALECTFYDEGKKVGAKTCAAGITNCVKAKTGDKMKQGCDEVVGLGDMTICGAYPDVAAGGCINIPQDAPAPTMFVICSTTDPVGAPAASDFTSCPTSTVSPTSAPAGAAVVLCMRALTVDDGTTSETSLATCTASGAWGNKGTMCVKTSYRDTASNKDLGLTQGCDGGLCSDITDRNTCCTNGDGGAKIICTTTNILSGVPTDSDFASCDTKCTRAPVAVASLAADRTSGALKHMFITMFFIAVTAAGVYA